MLAGELGRDGDEKLNSEDDDMVQIFISHSKDDEDIRKFFDERFARTTVKAVAMEFERYEPPASKVIMDQIIISDAVFVLLGPHITQKPATQSWVAFETGFAAGKAPPCHIWVFEPVQYAPIDFPVPFLHHYMPYDPNVPEHRDYITDIVKAYEPIFPIFRRIPQGAGLIECANCKSTYYLHTDTRSFYCPVCREPLER